MIKNQWYAVLESKEVKKQLVAAKRFGEKMLFFRDNSGKINCIADKCCHRGASLALGKHMGNTVACPFHGIEYNEKGLVTKIPANGSNAPIPKNFKVKAYTVMEKSGFIWLWYGEEREAYPPLHFFDELNDMCYTSIKDPWAVHYSRCIENQLDVAHVPFVHYNTIGRGDKTVVNGPKVIFEEDTLTFYVNNVYDDGKIIGKKPNEVTDYENFFSLKFRFPNIWQNIISDKMRVFAAFVPVDEENSIVYVRYYQSIIKVPVLKELFNFAGKALSKKVLKQDKTVVLTQIPIKTELHMKENLFSGDMPIIEYRKIRDKLLNP